MTKRWIGGGMLAAALIAGGCGGESSGPSNEEIFGTWRAAKVEYLAVAGGARVDLIGAGGSATLVLNQNMSGSYSYTPPGGAAELRTFTWSRDGENATWQYGPGNDDNFRTSLNGGVYGLELNGTKLFDCDGDGTREAAHWTLEFRR